jgi:hypothetical protein
MPKKAEPSKKPLKKIAIGGTVFVAIVLVAGWLFGWFSPDPALAEVRQLQAQLADPNLKDDARRALFQQMRTKMDSLSSDQRRGIWDQNRQEFEKRMDKHIDDLLAMSGKDRAKALDEDIDRMQKRAQERQANAQNGNANGGQGGQGGQGRGNRGQAQSDDQRLSRMKNRLNNSTPDSRAKRNAYNEMLAARMKERGITPPAGGGGGRGGGGGGGGRRG